MLNKNHPVFCIAFLAVVLLSASNVHSLSPSESYRFQINNFKFNDLQLGKKYNYFQTDQRIFMMNSNMTIANFVEISIPDIIFNQQVCSKFAFHSSELYSISACKDLSDNTTYLVMVSFLSSRPFYAYSLKTELKGVTSMKISGSVLVVESQAENTGARPKFDLFIVNLGGSSANKPIESVAHVDTEKITGLNSMITDAVKEALVSQSYLSSMRSRFGNDTVAVDCNKTFCKVFVSNSANNSIDVYDTENFLSFMFGSSSSTSAHLPNTTFREWFFLFLAILAGVGILAYCTSKKNGNTESEVAREQGTERVEGSVADNYRLVDNRDASLVSTPISRT